MFPDDTGTVVLTQGFDKTGPTASLPNTTKEKKQLRTLIFIFSRFQVNMFFFNVYYKIRKHVYTHTHITTHTHTKERKDSKH